jgi:hypothetical protein
MSAVFETRRIAEVEPLIFAIAPRPRETHPPEPDADRIDLRREPNQTLPPLEKWK